MLLFYWSFMLGMILEHCLAPIHCIGLLALPAVLLTCNSNKSTQLRHSQTAFCGTALFVVYAENAKQGCRTTLAVMK